MTPIILVLAGINGAGKSSGGTPGRKGNASSRPPFASGRITRRVKARVAAGGHNIPGAKIRERWDTSRLNLIMLMPHVTELRLFDNSEERDSVTGKIPPPKLLLHWKGGAVVGPPSSKLEATPEWAQPIVAYALQLQRAAAARRPGC